MNLPKYQLLAKQAIYNADKDCVGYELLFRCPMNIAASDVGSEVATQQVLVNYCASITDTAEGKACPVYINVDLEFLRSFSTLPVDPSKVNIEVNGIETLTSDEIDTLDAWRKQGFKLGLAGFRPTPEFIQLLRHFDFVKVDTLNTPVLEALPEKLKLIDRPDGQIWIAERLEHEPAYQHCKELGFDLFQGYFLARPQNVMGTSIRPGTIVATKIVQELDSPVISMDQIAELVSRDPKLAVQMLKIINSSFFSLPKKVNDLKSALVFLGIDMLRHWAMILAFLSNGALHLEASRIILSRAKTCELACSSNSSTAALAPNAFLAGLVSGVDVLFKIEPELFLKQVDLSNEIEEAVLAGQGVLGETLQKVKRLEHSMAFRQFKSSEFPSELLESFRTADEWVDEVMDVLKA